MYDSVIIGSGPGGYVSAIRLSQLGKKVAVIEKEDLGGTCTNKGCIPTKALLTSAHLYEKINTEAKKFGVKVENIDYDLKEIIKHMNKVVLQSRKGIEYLFKKNNVDLIKGVAEIIDKNHIKVLNQTIETKYIILAHGSQPVIFTPFDKIEGIWTSDDVFKMTELPDSILIVGGGVIGIEIATLFSNLGKKVYIVELLDHILPNEDPDVAEVAKKSLMKKGVEIFEKYKVTNVTKNKESYISKVEKDDESKEIESSKVLIAVGRRPLIPKDIKELGVTIEKGVKTDLSMKTNIENVYAIGDIRAHIMLAHVAMYEGIVAAHNIAGESKKMDYSAVPNVIFSNPEIATVGLKEKDVDLEKVIISKFPVSANARARTMEEREGFVKIIADKETKKVLGASIVSPNATDMIMEGVLAIKYGMTASQLVDSIHPHPTLTESILGAEEGIEGLTIHI
ncbi:dihydrolipoyl dehydrogenase [Petrotoga sp. 9PWA.NaAc.5.4]|uniref:dihydrolipoyl dehydrogenase n=1 Tax=Petrotoga sp. 9PWA.NaAc.5.4 TaxID=1434328 RepID=UPI000CC3CA7F|nr:dihydrolipoyl dehydrogenase [Petrotoga sp. 9PWA.NaAc.5.4]PNR92317.1 dihydrolipoamide dehydrogenase [Petrotoga sp. 9PWA.NaAc.5.4]